MLACSSREGQRGRTEASRFGNLQGYPGHNRQQKTSGGHVKKATGPHCCLTRTAPRNKDRKQSTAPATHVPYTRHSRYVPYIVRLSRTWKTHCSFSSATRAGQGRKDNVSVCDCDSWLIERVLEALHECTR